MSFFFKLQKQLTAKQVFLCFDKKIVYHIQNTKIVYHSYFVRKHVYQICLHILLLHNLKIAIIDY